MKKFLLLFCVGIMLASCQLKKMVTIYNTYPAYPETPAYYYQGQDLPENIKKVGTVVVGESGMTPSKKCSYNVCIEAIEMEAKKMGGDIIYLVRVKEPSVWGSSCYNITADIYVSADRQANVK